MEMEGETSEVKSVEVMKSNGCNVVDNEEEIIQQKETNNQTENVNSMKQMDDDMITAECFVDNSVETVSFDTKSDTNADVCPKKGALWDTYMLAVNGLPPAEAATVKQLLNSALGVGHHRIRPRLKGDTSIFVHFSSLEDMKIAEAALHNKVVKKHKLTVKEEHTQKQKRKLEDEQDDSEQVNKKYLLVQFLDETYEEQVQWKMQDVDSKLESVGKLIGQTYTRYKTFLSRRRLEHDGQFCAVDKIRECPPSENLGYTYIFVRGKDKDTGDLMLGIHVGDGLVRSPSSVKHDYPDHIVAASKVLENMEHISEKSVDGQGTLWQKVYVYTNSAQELMVLVFVDSGTAPEEVELFAEKLKEYFTNGDGKNCQITSLHINVMHTFLNENKLLIGAACLEETIAGLKIQLSPIRQLWSDFRGAEMLCKAVEELLVPTKEMTVLELGCGIGLFGLYLSKFVGQVLSVDVEPVIELAKKNAALNSVTNCEYFAGEVKDVLLHEVIHKISNKKVCAVLDYNMIRSRKKAMQELRRVEQMDRVVLVAEVYTLESVMQRLCKPSRGSKMGNPLFPTRVIPVDSFPGSKGNVLVILMERIELDDPQKTTSGQRGKSRGRGAKFSRLGSNSKRGRKEFLQWNFGRGPGTRQRFGGRRRPGQRAFGGVMDDYYLRMMEEEENGRIAMEEELRGRLEGEQWMQRMQGPPDMYRNNSVRSGNRAGFRSKMRPPSLLEIEIKPPPELLGPNAHGFYRGNVYQEQGLPNERHYRAMMQDEDTFMQRRAPNWNSGGSDMMYNNPHGTNWSGHQYTWRNQ